MMYAQGRNLSLAFKEAGFEEVDFHRARREGTDFYVEGYVLVGYAMMGDQRVRFEIRSPKQAREFLERWGQQQRREVMP